MPTTTTESPPAWPQPLIDALEHQQSLVDQLVPLVQKQAAMIESGRTDALLGLLGRRQQIIDQLTGSQAGLGELTQDLEQRLAKVPSEQREHIRSLIDYIGNALNDVMGRDDQDRQALEAGREGLKRELADVNAARQARSAYMQGKAVNNRFADQKG